MFKFFKKNKDSNNDSKSTIADIGKLAEQLSAESISSDYRTNLLIKDSGNLKMNVIKIVMTLNPDLGLKAAKEIVDTSGSFPTKLSSEQANQLIELCATNGIILEIV